MRRMLYKLIFGLLAGGIFVLPVLAAVPVKDGTLLQGKGAQVYVLDAGRKRPIPETDFSALGYQRAGIFKLSDAEIKKIPDGPPMTLAANYPEGTVFRNRLSRQKIYLLQGGKKRYIPSPDILKSLGYRSEDVVAMPYARFRKISEGAIITPAEKRDRPGEAGLAPLTFITSGPERTVSRRDVIFRYVGAASFGDPREVTFETKLDPVDKAWVDMGKQDKREVVLPPTGGSYTFTVRAKDSLGRIDPTPPGMNFILDLSEQYQRIKIESVNSRGRFADEEVRLKNVSGIPIDLTGWTLTNRRGERYTIVPLQNAIFPEVQPTQGVFVLPPNTIVRLFTGKSPRGERTFRLNICSGYLNQDFVFNPRLPEECPQPWREVIETFEPRCRTFLERAPRCRVPKTLDTPIEADWFCTGYVADHLNYAGCVRDNISKVDFWKNEWWAYLTGSRAVWDPVHDTILLEDNAGQTVDRFSY